MTPWAAGWVDDGWMVVCDGYVHPSSLMALQPGVGL
jgi:hypothetical protein